MGFFSNYNNMMNFGFGGGFLFGWIFMALIWVFVILGIIALIKYLSGKK